ncbi:mCG1028340, partial [Mus musculus]
FHTLVDLCIADGPGGQLAFPGQTTVLSWKTSSKHPVTFSRHGLIESMSTQMEGSYVLLLTVIVPSPCWISKR